MLATSLVFAPVLTGIIILFFTSKRSVEIAHILGTVITAVLGILLLTAAKPADAFWLIDGLSKYFVGVITVVYFLASIFSIRYLLPEYLEGKLSLLKLRHYYLWLHIFAATMYLTVLVNNLGLMWVAIELTTLISALLVGFYNNKASLEAAWKYIFLCSVGIALALFGLIMLFYATENVLGSSSEVLCWTKLVQNAQRFDGDILKLAFIFIVVGYGTKVGLAPMHSWLPDAHSQAPSPISAMLSGVLLNCALYGILRFQAIVNSNLMNNDFTSHILIALGGFSILISLPFIIVQSDIKRLLAYSSIEHMGLITLAFGIGNKLAVYGALLHILFHAFAKSSLFFSVGDITNYWHTKKIARIKGIAEVFPLQGWVTFIALFALAGSPPFGLFRSEFLILLGAVSDKQWYAAIIVLAALVTAFAALVYHFGNMVTGTAKKKIMLKNAQRTYNQPLFILVPVLALLIFGLWIPGFLENSAAAAGNVLLGGEM